MPNTHTEALPRSTLAVFLALWAISTALVGWVLLETVDNGKQMAAVLRDQDNALMNLAEVRADVDDHETRIRTLERPRR